MKKLLSLVLTIAAVSALCACGGGSGSSSSAAPAQTEAATESAAAESAASEAKKWVIATDTVFRPFEFKDADGNFVGIDVDILAAIAEDQGFEYELNSLGWDSAIAA